MERIARKCFGILLALALSSSLSSAQDIVPLGRLFNYWDSATDVVVDGDYAYVATGISGLQVVDISDPQNMRVVGVFDDIEAKMNKVLKVGNLIYALTEIGFHIIDVYDKTELVEVAYFKTGLYSWSIAEANGLLAVGKLNDEHGRQTGSFWLFDVSEPDAIEFLDSLTFEAFGVWDIALSGDRAYLAAENNFIAVDISNPNELDIIGISEDWPYIRVIAVEDQYAYFGTDNGFYIFDISDLNDMWQIYFERNNNYCNEIRIRDRNLMYSFEEGMNFYSFTGEGMYQLRRSIGNANITSADGTLNSLFIANRENGLYNLDITDPNNIDTLSLISRTSLNAGNITDAKLWDQTAYCSKGSLSIIDVNDPNNPVIINELDTPTYWLELDKENALLYSSGRGNSFCVFDMSDRRFPVLLGTYRGIDISKFAFQGEFIYTPLCILDVSEPTSPIRRGRFSQDQMMATDCAVSGHYVFLIGIPLGFDNVPDLIVFDISDRDDPTPVFEGIMGLSGREGGIIAHNGYLFSSGWSNQLVVIDVTDPTEPSVVCRVAAGGSINDIDVYDDILVCTSIEGMITTFDVVNSENPEVIDQFQDCFFTQSISVEGNIAAVAQSTSLRFYNLDGERSVPILESAPPIDGRLISAFPNPFNDRMTIKIDLPGTAPMQLILFDLTGRSLKQWTLSERLLPSQNRVILDRNSLPSGSLYLQATSGKRSETLPIMHLK